MKASNGNPPRVLSTTRKFDPDSQLVLFMVERMPEIDDDWGLILGDAIYNLRCALDHLWWQLAIEHLGREPTDQEAPSIQFPILTDKTPEVFDGHRFLKFVDEEAAAKAKRLQRYDRGEDQFPILSALADLSNHDRHRQIRPTFLINTNISAAIHPYEQAMIDCEIPSKLVGDKRVFDSEVVTGPNRPKVGDVVFGMKVTPTGPNPDIDVEPEVTLDVALGEGEYTQGIFDEMGRFVWTVLNDFAPLLRNPNAS